MPVVGLTRSTTIEAIDTLVGRGLLRELPNARQSGEYRKGRPARRFEFRADAGVLVGVDAGHEHVSVAVTDLRGEVLATHRLTLEIDRDDAAARRVMIGGAVDAALAAASHGRECVVAVCVGVPAPVDADGRSPDHRNDFWARMNPDLVGLFGEWAPLVRIENDASLAAIAEGARGAALGCRNYVTLLAGARLGAGVVVDGHVLRGAHGGVGEMVAFDHVDGVGTADGLGARAAQWAREAVALGEVSPEGSLSALAPEDVDGRVVLELAADGDLDARRVIERVALVLARVVGVLGSMFDPERVIVSGAISATVEPVVTAARGALASDLDLPAPELLASPLGADIVMTGGILAAVEDARARLLDLGPPHGTTDRLATEPS